MNRMKKVLLIVMLFCFPVFSHAGDTLAECITGSNVHIWWDGTCSYWRNAVLANGYYSASSDTWGAGSVFEFTDDWMWTYPQSGYYWLYAYINVTFNTTPGDVDMLVEAKYTTSLSGGTYSLSSKYFFGFNYTGTYSYLFAVKVRFPQDIFYNTDARISFNISLGDPGNHYTGDDYYLYTNVSKWVHLTQYVIEEPTPTGTTTPTSTSTPTNTGTPTSTPTPTKTNTGTPIPGTSTPTPTWTGVPTVTNTPTRTNTPTVTPTGTKTFTPTHTFTYTPTMTSTPTGTMSPTLRPYSIYGDIAWAKHSAPGIFADLLYGATDNQFVAEGTIHIKGRVTNLGRDLFYASGHGSTITNGISLSPTPGMAWIVSSSTSSYANMPNGWSWMLHTDIPIDNWETGDYYIRTDIAAIGFTDSDTTDNSDYIAIHLLKPTATYTPTFTPTPTATQTPTPTKTPTPWAFINYYRGGEKLCPLVEYGRKIGGMTYLAAGYINGVSVFAKVTSSPAPPSGSLLLYRGSTLYYFDLR